MTKSKASVYLAGHDHCAEYLEAYDFAHHGCGAAHEYDPSTAHESVVPKGSLKWHHEFSGSDATKENYTLGAFAVATFNKTSLNIVHYDHTGKEIFAAPPIAPRDVSF